MASRHGTFTVVLAGIFALPVHAAWKLTDTETVTRSGTAVAPVVSSDGRRIAYVVGSRLAVSAGPDVITGRLWVLDRATRDASRVSRLNSDLVAGEAPIAFGADGATAYIEGPRSAPILWYVDADGGRFRVGPGRSAAFSPDAKFLAWTVWDRSGGAAVELRLFDTEKHESKTLARLPASGALTIAEMPRWSADGSRIVVHSGGDLFTYGRFTGRVATATDTHDVVSFDVLPNDRLVYLRGGTADPGGIWTVRMDGRDAQPAALAAELPTGVSDLASGPDADSVLFIADTARGRGIVVMNTKTGRWRYAARADAFAVQPGGSLVAMETADADGKHNITAGRLQWQADGSRPSARR